MSDISLLKQIEEYKKDHCYQYEKRIQTFEEDMRMYGWSQQDLENIKLDDFDFSIIETKRRKERSD